MLKKENKHLNKKNRTEDQLDSSDTTWRDAKLTDDSNQATVKKQQIGLNWFTTERGSKGENPVAGSVCCLNRINLSILYWRESA
jgi:hypothetical protein